MNKVRQGFLVMCGVMLLSCSDDDSAQILNNNNNSNEEPVHLQQKPKLNIADAKSIVVYKGSSNSGGRVASDETNLYKIMVDGSVERVKFIKEDNTDVDPNVTPTNIQVEAVYDVNKSFLILQGWFEAWDTLGHAVAYQNLLVRKNDGAIFNFPPYMSLIGANFGDNLFQDDASGNLYYLYNSFVNKVDVSDPSNLSIVSYLASGQYPTRFAVDAQGNCMYEASYSKRIQKKSGGIYEFAQQSYETGYVNQFWAGANGNLYFTSYDKEKEVPTINKVVINENNDVTSDVVWEAPMPGTYSGVLNLNYGSAFKIKKANSVVFIEYNDTEVKSSFEFFENDNSVLEFALPRIPYGYTTIVYSKNYYYLSTKGKIYRVSLLDHSYESILPAAQYEVYTIMVDDNDVLQISALRFSDGKKIIAEINLQNELTVVEEEKDQDVLYLQRLN